MRHHMHKSGIDFCVLPQEFNKHSDRSFLQYCLGGTLYMPSTRNILDKILSKSMDGLTSMVMCFEDAIQEADVAIGEHNVLQHLKAIADALHNGDIDVNDIPLIFLRVRNTQQFQSFASKLEAQHIEGLTGFVFPKFYSNNGSEYYQILESVNDRFSSNLYGMPILEGRTIALKESRIEELMSIRTIIDPYRKRVLNVRVGGTDFSSIFGVRRGISHSIYDILTVRDCLSDILNFFTRVDADYVVSGPVWEYFLADKKESLDNLMEEDFHRSLLRWNTILNEAIDGLLREVILDKANGFVGKTIIHPSHLKFVNAMQAVTKEEYEDAVQIFNTGGGVVKSAKANKMNEINPHRNWAVKILNRAKAYGVIQDESSFLKLCM